MLPALESVHYRYKFIELDFSLCCCLDQSLQRSENFNSALITGSAVATALTVLTATGLVNGEWQISTPYRIETPEPIDKKFGTGD